MRKLYIILALILGLQYNSWSNPSNSISIQYPAVSNALIASADYNSNNNEIQTKFNSHTHTDLTQVGTITTGVWAGTPITYPFLNLSGQILPADISTGYGLVPSGAIIMWSGTVANIPSGWYLCDGTHSTPDLRDKFIVGAKQDDAGVAKTNVSGSLTQSGGNASLNLAHTHTVANTGWGYNNAASDRGTLASASNEGNVYSAINTANGINTGSAGTVTNILNPYYALCFIMKS